MSFVTITFPYTGTGDQTEMECSTFFMQFSDENLESAVYPRHGLVGKAPIDLVLVVFGPFT